MLGAAEQDVLRNAAADVFEADPIPTWNSEFLADPRHHLAVAIDAHGRVVGMASGVHYLHPDKPPQIFFNEVGGSAAWPIRRRS